jgi:hypothetical protein
MGTADVSYVPGALTAVAGDQCWALVEITPDSPAVSRIWRQLGQGVAADALLAGLLADGIGGTPGFTLLVAGPGGQHRLFCRGTVGATLVTSRPPAGHASPAAGQAGTIRIDGSGLLTWREEVVDGAELIFLGEPPADTALRLPATSGVLLAACVVVDLAGRAARGVVSYPLEPPAAPEPLPAPEQPKKTVVFFPDTITVTGPGGAAGGGQVLAADGQSAPGSREPVARTLPPLPVAPVSSASPVLPVPLAPRLAGPSADPQLPAPGTPQAAAATETAGGLNGGPGSDGEYDFLWGATQARSVESAAVRAEAGDPAAASGRLPGDGVPTAGLPVTGGPDVLPGGPSAPYPNSPPPSRPRPGPLDPAWPGELPPGPPLAGMMRAGGTIAPGPPQQADPPAAPVPARVPGPPGGLIDVPPWLPGPAEVGSTAKRGDLPEPVSVTHPPDRIGPVVPALICPGGHVNPPSGATCRRCGAPLPHDPVPVPRPVLGVLRLSLGDVIALDRGVLMGRNPRADFGGTAGEERPHVVKLPSADGDISRTHLRVTLDGWHVLVTDLNSTNGTLITLPGRDPQQLRPGEPVPMQPGTVVVLADGVDFRYEVTE